jgi:hypothetical protein
MASTCRRSCVCQGVPEEFTVEEVCVRRVVAVVLAYAYHCPRRTSVIAMFSVLKRVLAQTVAKAGVDRRRVACVLSAVMPHSWNEITMTFLYMLGLVQHHANLRGLVEDVLHIVREVPLCPRLGSDSRFTIVHLATENYFF